HLQNLRALLHKGMLKVDRAEIVEEAMLGEARVVIREVVQAEARVEIQKDEVGVSFYLFIFTFRSV
ncbi:MAG: hypothetical protein Q8P27_02720, partial [Candidatus Peregrinibacteria bacterium]|nr:hypothetical protein [Candidatus Peregrinibacteria bacterium]